MKFISKINPISGLIKKKDAQGAEVWVVSWYARYGKWSECMERVSKAFLLEEDAKLFAKSLRDAQDLLQYTERIEISITKQK